MNKYSANFSITVISLIPPSAKKYIYIYTSILKPTIVKAGITEEVRGQSINPLMQQDSNKKNTHGFFFSPKTQVFPAV